MAAFTINEGARVSRRTRAAVHGLNEEIEGLGTEWRQTAAGQRAATMRLGTRFVSVLAAMVLGGTATYIATHNLGRALLVPILGVLTLNALWWLFTEETLTCFLASILFGVASTPKKYVLNALEKGTVTAAWYDKEWLVRR